MCKPQKVVGNSMAKMDRFGKRKASDVRAMLRGSDE